MTEKRTYQNVKKFWNQEAKKKGATPLVTIRDHFFRLIELKILNSLIPFQSTVLDAGCGTGFGSVILGLKAKKVLGFDYSPEMINWANKLIADKNYRRKLFSDLGYDINLKADVKNVSFIIQDTLKPLDKEIYNVITGQRVLINMTNHESQVRMLENLTKNADKSTLFIFTEATKQGHARTDELRANFNIEILEKYWRNCYVDENRLKDWDKIGLKINQILTFDTYFLLSKIIYPAAYGSENCQFLSGANKAAYEISELFRTKQAVEEVGLENFFNLYLKKLLFYDVKEHQAIKKWLAKNFSKIESLDWAGLGHQKIFVMSLK